MSLWGPLSYENDDAADWLADLADEPSIVALNDAFDEVLPGSGNEYLEVTEGAVAVAAAAVVAVLFGQPGSEPESLIDEDAMDALAQQRDQLAPGARISLLERAIAGMKAVSDDIESSELYALAMEDEDIAKAWKKSVAGLIRRLEKARKLLTTR